MGDKYTLEQLAAHDPKDITGAYANKKQGTFVRTATGGTIGVDGSIDDCKAVLDGSYVNPDAPVAKEPEVLEPQVVGDENGENGDDDDGDDDDEEGEPEEEPPSAVSEEAAMAEAAAPKKRAAKKATKPTRKK
ncbi:MAG: hypothetical protein GY906_38580 [bacterium]|nr:hypothetical protein [bacterium]